MGQRPGQAGMQEASEYPEPLKMRPLLALLLAAGPAAALDVPTGPMPKIDGILDKEEWAGALKLRAGSGVLRLKVAQGALCMALEMEAPYAGERLDLHVTDSKGRVYVRHSFHPACYLPRFPFMFRV